jgi:hypothetical protein
MGGTIDTPKSIVRRSIDRAVKNGNDVIGISKKSVLRDIFGNQLTDIIPEESRPCYVDVHDSLTRGIRDKCLGHVYIVKFRVMGPSFRVDVHPSDGDPIGSLWRLYSSPNFYRGYPDALRTAHLLVAFKRNELVGIQSYISNAIGGQIVTEFDVRRYILSPFI